MPVGLDGGNPPASRWSEDLASAAMALARRTAAGATMWCWSPQWPQHADHVAVEFVHPVIMGTRALPAEVVVDPDPIGSLRTLVEPGDVLVVVAQTPAPGAEALLRRAPAWGVESFWIGLGDRPQPGTADHLIWLDPPAGAGGANPGAGPEAAFDGRVVLSYHVLWELTHVCFEHPGLLAAPATGECEGDRCVTCADEGRLAEVVEPAGPATVVVRAAGQLEDVDSSLVDPLAPGDLVLVHAGVAISRVEEVGA